MAKTAQRAAGLASERGLAYVVVPRPGNDRPGLAVPGVTDAGEYEFSNLRVPVRVLVAVIRQALARLDLGQGVLSVLTAETGRSTYRTQRGILDRHQAALEMAAEWCRDLKDDSILETGGSEFGASWGHGLSAVFSRVKAAEAHLGTVPVLAREEVLASLNDDDRRAVAERLAGLAAAVLED